MKQDKRFERNRGFIAADEQRQMREATVGIAGCGGDGGKLAITLARMGVGSFHLADPEHFDLENLNRQAGSTTDTVGQNKAIVIAQIIKAVNPGASVSVFEEGITEGNIDTFLKGVTLVADEMEFTQHWLAVMVGRKCRELGIPVVMGLNVGFGCMVTSFMPKSRTIEQVLGLQPNASIEELRKATVPLSKWVPRIPGYVAMNVLEAVAAGKISAPSVAPGVDLASGYTAVEAFNHITHRRMPIVAPRVLWFDAMERKSGVIKLPTLGYVASVARMAIRAKAGLNKEITI